MAPAKRRPPIIGAICAFDAKIYKIVGGVFDVSACGEGNKKNFKNCDFCSALPSLLVENLPEFYLFFSRYNACWATVSSIAANFLFLAILPAIHFRAIVRQTKKVSQATNVLVIKIVIESDN